MEIAAINLNRKKEKHDASFLETRMKMMHAYIINKVLFWPIV